MSRRWIRRVGSGLAAVAALLAVALAAVYGFSEARYRRQYGVVPRAVSIPRDSAAIARGAHLANSFAGCAECHGENLAGGLIIDNPLLGTVYAANLTRGRGGLGASLSDVDYVRAIRHGLTPDGRALKIMPSTDYIGMTDEDLGAVIAYAKSVKPVDNEQPALRVGPLARALMVGGKMPILNAERIDHASPGPVSITAAPTVAYGAYVASVGCKGCHGPQFAGGPIVTGPPDWPPAANLTPAGDLKSWTESDFARVLRTGIRPNGIPVNTVMPVRRTRNLDDVEVRALWLYLKSLPAVPAASMSAPKVATLDR